MARSSAFSNRRTRQMPVSRKRWLLDDLTRDWAPPTNALVANELYGPLQAGNWSNNALSVFVQYEKPLSAGSVQVVWFHGQSNTAPDIVDDAGQTWVAINSVTDAGGGAKWWYCITQAAQVGTRPTVTCDFNTTVVQTLIISEWFGIDASGPIDGSNIASGTATSNTASAGPTGTASNTGYLGLFAAGSRGSADVFGYTGFGAVAWRLNAAGQLSAILTYKKLGAETLTGSASLSHGADPWFALVAIFRTGGVVGKVKNVTWVARSRSAVM